MTVKYMMLSTPLEFRLSLFSVLIKPSFIVCFLMFSGGCLKICEHG